MKTVYQIGGNFKKNARAQQRRFFFFFWGDNVDKPPHTNTFVTMPQPCMRRKSSSHIGVECLATADKKINI